MSVYLIKVFNSLNERVSGLDNLANNDLFAVYAVKLTSLHNSTWNCWPEQNICENLCKLIFQWESIFCFFVWFGLGGGGFLEWIFFYYFLFLNILYMSDIHLVRGVLQIEKNYRNLQNFQESLQLYYLLDRSGGSRVFNEST